MCQGWQQTSTTSSAEMCLEQITVLNELCWRTLVVDEHIQPGWTEDYEGRWETGVMKLEIRTTKQALPE